MVKTLAYVHRPLNETSDNETNWPEKKTVNPEVYMFKILREERFSDEMKSLRAEEEIAKDGRSLEFSLDVD